jgi:hypothetical protein
LNPGKRATFASMGVTSASTAITPVESSPSHALESTNLADCTVQTVHPVTLVTLVTDLVTLFRRRK